MKNRILFAPLDWGLGHATRCIPLISYYINNGYTIFIAADGKIEFLLKTEFPQAHFLTLPGYKITYSKNKWTLPLILLLQVPKLISIIKYENGWIKKMVAEHKIDLIISDNRFGLYHPTTPSIFITHQLIIKAPFKWAEKLIQKLNYHFINKFSTCWVPDFEGEVNLGNTLSHPEVKPKTKVQYIGPLSRFSYKQNDSANNYLLILLSGPEPQRSLLEAKLLHQLSYYNKKAVVIRGLPGESNLPQSLPHITLLNHLPSHKMEEVFSNAAFIISRCGYSTVMDVVAMKKKGIFIPTPGQTEQEYLAQHLMKAGIALCIPQHLFVLEDALSEANLFPYQTASLHFKIDLPQLPQL